MLTCMAKCHLQSSQEPDQIEVVRKQVILRQFRGYLRCLSKKACTAIATNKKVVPVDFPQTCQMSIVYRFSVESLHILEDALKRDTVNCTEFRAQTH